MLINPLNKYKKFIDFLNKALPVKNDYYVEFLNGYDSIKIITKSTGNIEYGFAIYKPDNKTMYIPTKTPTWIVNTSMAHEYVHIWQEDNNNPFNEEEAEKVSKDLFNAFYKS
jgi:Zn-dependent peptidase ImmA (M78 family)